MVVHSITIFDRKGKTVFTKTFSQAALKQQQILQQTGPADPGSDAVTEQRKLVFGMLFSLREILGSLSPEDTLPSLHSVKTGSSTVHNFETLNGLRFTLYTSNDVPTTIDSTSPTDATVISARDVLKHIYSNIYVEQVVRSPLYTTDGKDFDINHTNFERDLDSYMKSIPWFR